MSSLHARVTVEAAILLAPTPQPSLLSVNNKLRVVMIWGGVQMGIELNKCQCHFTVAVLHLESFFAER